MMIFFWFILCLAFLNQFWVVWKYGSVCQWHEDFGAKTKWYRRDKCDQLNWLRLERLLETT